MVAGLGAAAVSVDLPGSGSNNPITKESYTYKASVSIAVKDFAGTPIIDEDTFSTCVAKNAFSLSFGNTPNSLSLTKVGNNEVTWTLKGANLDTPISKKENLGDIARVAGKKTSNFKLSHLEPGTYTQVIDVTNEDGSTRFTKNVQINENTAVSSCGGFF